MICKIGEIVGTIFFIVLLARVNAKLSLNLTGGNAQLTLEEAELGARVVFTLGDQVRLSGVIGLQRSFSGAICSGTTCTIDDVSVSVTPKDDVDGGFVIIWTSSNVETVFKDCYELSTFNWFGGPQRYVQKWPIEKLVLDGDDPYIIKKSDNFAVAERYWLNSQGDYIFIDDKVPLFIDQNNENEGTICLIAKAENPYINRDRVILNYTMGFETNAKLAHLTAVNTYLGKPKGHPNENMIRDPIWTTWAKFKKNVDDEIVLGFANDIVDHGFHAGQIEIDEDWEVCFGAHVFKEDKFGKINQTVQSIKDLGFRVTLWINPFVNNDCEDYSSVGLANGYFVKNVNGSTQAIWWEGDDAHQIDFTKEEAAQWFTDRIKVLLENPGVDSFKFDAGETDYAIPPSLYENVDPEDVPNILTSSYIKTIAQFGDLIEARSAWRSQENPFFLRMIDKDSVWGDDDGLYTLVTTLLQLNINGYTMVLPDMIGGNGYKAQPTAELIVRWAEANAFMPAMQLSFLPWDYATDEFDGTEIVRNFINLHAEYTDEIIKAMEASIEVGTPVNPPIWWVDPTDLKALATDDEFLLGENILVAPVLIEGAVSRDVYLPKGSWKDGNDGTIYEGPKTIRDYSAPIDVLPYFIKQ